MKTVFDNSELAHVYASQKQDYGKGSNMFFEKTKIYSYGHHYCIANFIKPNVVLWNVNKSSMTTESKHKNKVSSAVSHVEYLFDVPYVDISLYEKEYHLKNLEYLKNLSIDRLKKAETSHKYSGSLVAEAKNYKRQGLSYCKIFKLGKSAEKWFITPLDISQKLFERIEAQEEKVIRAKEIEERENAVRNNELRTIVLPAWLKSEEPSDIDAHPKHKSHYVSELPESYLRVSGSNVETSHGARVPLKAAKLLYDRIESGKDVKGFAIGNYTVISINGVLKVGCHVIERDEIKRFASSQGW